MNELDDISEDDFSDMNWADRCKLAAVILGINVEDILAAFLAKAREDIANRE